MPGAEGAADQDDTPLEGHPRHHAPDTMQLEGHPQHGSCITCKHLRDELERRDAEVRKLRAQVQRLCSYMQDELAAGSSDAAPADPRVR